MVRQLAGVEVAADQPLHDAGLDDVGGSGFRIDLAVHYKPGIMTTVAHQTDRAPPDRAATLDQCDQYNIECPRSGGLCSEF